MESVEPARIGNELRPFRLEHLPDRLLGQLRMAMRLGIGDAFVEQPGVQLVVGLEPQPWREEALADKPDLVLDLALLPTGCRRAGDRLDNVMAAHLQEATIVEAILANEDRLHRRLHVVVDAALRVPREVFDNRILNSSPTEIRAFLSNHHNDAEWLLALRTAGRGDANRGLLMDEFTATGGTFERLHRLPRLPRSRALS